MWSDCLLGGSEYLPLGVFSVALLVACDLSGYFSAQCSYGLIVGVAAWCVRHWWNAYDTTGRAGGLQRGAYQFWRFRD